MQSRVRSLVNLILAVAVLSIAVVGGGAWWNLRDAGSADAKLRANLELLGGLGEVQGEVGSLDTAARAYLFTKDPQALAKYRAAVAGLEGAIAGVRASTPEEAGLAARVDSLEALTDEQIARYDAALEQAKPQDAPESLDPAVVLQNSATSAEITALVSEMRTEARATLNQLDADSGDVDARRANATASLTVAAIVILLLATLFANRRLGRAGGGIADAEQSESDFRRAA